MDHRKHLRAAGLAGATIGMAAAICAVIVGIFWFLSDHHPLWAVSTIFVACFLILYVTALSDE